MIRDSKIMSYIDISTFLLRKNPEVIVP